MAPPPDFAAAIASTGFGEAAIRYTLDPRFQAYEVDYKRRLAVALRDAVEAIAQNNGSWLDKLRSALQSSDNNIINWRVEAPFLAWCHDDPIVAATSIGLLCNGLGPARERLERFAAVLSGAGLHQLGQQLVVGSVLLMAREPDSHPPVRTRVVSNAFSALGLPDGEPKGIGDRYSWFMSLLDALITYSQAGPRPLQSRLEAQGAVWCATGGWSAEPSIDDSRDLVADVDEAADDDIEAAQAELAGLDETERAAVVTARRGQGRYRRDLLDLWVGCAVTGCASEAMLRASHLKPWRHSDNHDRVNPFNGLLLTPNLDQALDRCLIAFNVDGTILMSSTLSRQDAQGLGISSSMKLRFVRSQHQEFLTYHRSLFEKRERLLALSSTSASLTDEEG